VRSLEYPGVIDQVPFFASGKTITYLPPPAGYGHAIGRGDRIAANSGVPWID